MHAQRHNSMRMHDASISILTANTNWLFRMLVVREAANVAIHLPWIELLLRLRMLVLREGLSRWMPSSGCSHVVRKRDHDQIAVLIAARLQNVNILSKL